MASVASHPPQKQELLCADQAATVHPAGERHSNADQHADPTADAMLQPAESSPVDGETAGGQQLLPDLNTQPS